MKKGFTLIELLVVVLIIGILSAVALPQYQKAVKKAKAAEVWTVARAILDSQDRYRMETGSWAESLENLDVEIPEMKNWEIREEISFAGGDPATGESVGIHFDPKFEVKDFFTYSYWTHIDGSKRVSCQAATEECMHLLPCLGVGSGSLGAHCTL